jgi:hypothetical protein
MLPSDTQSRLGDLERETEVLDRSVGVIQEIQSQVPRPSREEVEEIRSGQRIMNRDEYLLARLQRVVVTLENVVSDLRVDLEYGFEPVPFDLLEDDVNALAAAVDELGSAGEIGG